ncbi:MAG TPA: hypothetical protein VHM72_06850 [Solirubrobacteraceae bacterium]|nr:hypothetical protein [Solirubrobacteraceae bacterium]
MSYCVIPRQLEGDLLEPLRAHYAGDPDMKVIVDRREHERRNPSLSGGKREQRTLRDRRRRRVSGDLPPLYGESGAFVTE